MIYIYNIYIYMCNIIYNIICIYYIYMTCSKTYPLTSPGKLWVKCPGATAQGEMAQETEAPRNRGADPSGTGETCGFFQK